MYKICKKISYYCSMYKRLYCTHRTFSYVRYNIEIGKQNDNMFVNIHKCPNDSTKQNMTAVTYIDNDFNAGRKRLHDIQNIVIRCVYFTLCMFAMILCAYGAIGYLYVIYDFFNYR